MKKVFWIVFLVLLLDQGSKFWVKMNFRLGEEVYLLSWFRIHFVENNGAAWGVEFGGKVGKLILTLFRVIAITGIGYWIYRSVRRGVKPLALVGFSLIFAGALGNIIDSVFYGILFDDSVGHIAALFPKKPYGHLLFGKVVDMLYFPIWKGLLPNWLPFFGGQPFTFFNAIFNIADSSIFIGICLLLFFQKKKNLNVTNRVLPK